MRLITRVFFLVAITVSILSCSGGGEQKEAKDKETNIIQEIEVYEGVHNVDLIKSTIVWTGYKVLGRNTGRINLSKGHLEFKDGEIIDGGFIVDMKSIMTTDMVDEDESHEETEDDEFEGHSDKTELSQHLKSDDYFDVLQYPTATFIIDDAQRINNEYGVSGKITIKGTTKAISFKAELLGKNHIRSLIKIKRSDFGIEHSTQILNSVVKDEFELMVTLFLK